MKKNLLLNGTRLLSSLAIIAIAAIISSCQKDENMLSTDDESGSILQTIENFSEEFEYDEYDSLGSSTDARGWGYYRVWARPTFNTLLTALEYTGLDEVVQAQETTIFGPTDKAFRKLGLNEHNITDVPKDELVNILTYHVLAGKVFKKQVETGPITMLNGQDVRAFKYYFWLFLKGKENKYWSQVIYPDVHAFNGVFHVVNRVLLPKPVEKKNLVETLQDKGFKTLVELATTAGLGDALAEGGPFTVFAPNEKAFEKLLESLTEDEIAALLDNDAELLRKVLLHHVVEGKIFSSDLTNAKVKTLNGDKIEVNADKLTIKSSSGNEVNLVLSGVDTEASNGVVHEIDEVLIPEEIAAALRKNIVETLIAKEFNTLVDLASTAGLAETLANGGPFTVFAPNEKAFEKLFATLSDMEVEALLANDAELLRKVLLHHVLSGTVLSSDLTTGPVETLNGDKIAVDAHDLTITSSSGNTVNLVLSGVDSKASNGVIHEIDEVLIPEEIAEALKKNIVETLLANGFNTLVDLASTAGLGDALANGGPFTVFAPNEMAFEKLFDALSGDEVDALLANDAELLRKVLLHHVLEGAVFSSDLTSGKVKTLNGDKIKVNVHDLTLKSSSGNKVNLVTSGLDIEASNGVIHEIDEVLIPKEIADALRKNIVETLVDKGFKTLVDFAATAGLADVLANQGPFTIFAPNERAFAKLLDVLSDDQVEKLLANDAALLQKVLLHHVVEGTVLSTDLRPGRVKTLNGDKVLIKPHQLVIKSSSGNRAHLVKEGLDCLASNGVIHEITDVLIPKNVVEALTDDDYDDDEYDDDDRS